MTESFTEPSIVATEARATVFTCSHAEIVIDRPAKDVWKAILWSSIAAVKAWNPTVTELIHVSGEPDQEGELVKTVKNGKRVFFMRTVRLVHLQQRVLYLYGEGYEGGGNFVDHSLYEISGKTKFVYRNYAWKQTPVIEAEHSRADAGRAKADVMGYLNNALRLLKQEVERDV